MNTIHSTYLINENTTALLPSQNKEYSCIVREVNKQIFVKQTPFELIKQACLRYGSTYEGRRQAVMHQTGFKRKVPIPISIQKNIYTFPTLPILDEECIWLFSKHIHTIQPDPSKNTFTTHIQFNNHQSLSLPLSTHIIENQQKRAITCKFIFQRMA